MISGEKGQECLAGIKYKKAASHSLPEEVRQALSAGLKCSEA